VRSLPIPFRFLVVSIPPILALTVASRLEPIHAALASTSPAGPPPGYFVDWAAAASPIPRPPEGDAGDYTCILEREAPDSASSRLLAIAECVYPPRELLSDLAASRNWEIGSDTAKVPLWWARGTNERRIPYAATRGGLEHYLRLTQKYRDRDFMEPGAHRIFESELIYRASMARRVEFVLGMQSFKDVYVARIELSWSYDDGTFLPLVTAHRTVVLSPAGKILAVDGDGQGTEEVSISANRGVGRQRELR